MTSSSRQKLGNFDSENILSLAGFLIFRCRQTDDCSPIHPIPPALLHLKVTPPSTGEVYLTGVANILAPASLLLRDAGIMLLNDVIIKMKQTKEVGELMTS